MMFHICISQSDKLVRETGCMKKLSFSDIKNTHFLSNMNRELKEQVLLNWHAKYLVFQNRFLGHLSFHSKPEVQHSTAALCVISHPLFILFNNFLIDLHSVFPELPHFIKHICCTSNISFICKSSSTLYSITKLKYLSEDTGGSLCSVVLHNLPVSVV